MPDPAAAPAVHTRALQAALLRAVALASGVVAAVVAALLALNHVQTKSVDPLNAPALLELAKRAAANPADTNLVAHARAMDLLARRAFFASQAHVRGGAWILLAASVVLLGSLKGLSAVDTRKPPRGAPCGETTADHARASRIGAAVFGVAAVGVAAALAVTSRDEVSAAPAPGPIAIAAPSPATPTPATPTPGATDPAAPADAPIATGAQTAHAPIAGTSAAAPAPAVANAVPEAEMLANWPAFRGHRGLGGSVTGACPVKWNGATAEGIAWKSEIPRPGAGSVVVWDNRAYVSGADETAREIFCYDTANGALLWRHAATNIPGSPAQMPTVSDDAGLAAATMATDGRLVFAVFATGDLVACDPAGRRAWARNLGVPKNPYGYVSSPVVFGGRLFVQYDQEEGAKMIALDAATGTDVWSVAREVKPSWASPIVADAAGKPVLVTFGNPALTAYDPATGKQLWRADNFEAEVAASPASGGGRVFAGNEYARLAGFDLATGKQLWTIDEDLPEVSAPLPVGDLLFVATSSGLIVCRDAATGAKHWSKEFSEGFYASPMAAGGNVYLTDRNGLTRVFKASKTFELVAENALGEKNDATPAFVGGRIYVRSAKTLYAIGPAAKAAP